MDHYSIGFSDTSLPVVEQDLSLPSGRSISGTGTGLFSDIILNQGYPSNSPDIRTKPVLSFVVVSGSAAQSELLSVYFANSRPEPRQRTPKKAFGVFLVGEVARQLGGISGALFSTESMWNFGSFGTQTNESFAETVSVAPQTQSVFAQGATEIAVIDEYSRDDRVVLVFVNRKQKLRKFTIVVAGDINDDVIIDSLIRRELAVLSRGINGNVDFCYLTWNGPLDEFSAVGASAALVYRR